MKNSDRPIKTLCFLFIPLLFACTTQSKVQPPSESDHAGTVLMHNAWPVGLSVSAYQPGAKSQAVWTAGTIGPGATRRLFGLPGDRKINLRVLDEAAAATNYTLVRDGATEAFTINSRRSYDLGFAPNPSASGLLAWSWKLAADPAVEVGALSFKASTRSLAFTWKDPPMSDLISVNIYDRGTKSLLTSIARGVQAATLTGLAGGKTLDLAIACAYPEIESRGLAFRATPLLPRPTPHPPAPAVKPPVENLGSEASPAALENIAVEGRSDLAAGYSGPSSEAALRIETNQTEPSGEETPVPTGSADGQERLEPGEDGQGSDLVMPSEPAHPSSVDQASGDPSGGGRVGIPVPH